MKRSKKIKKEKFEVIVVGGGLAGVCAAIASARKGAKTCIIQDRPVFGGNSSSEIRVPPVGAGYPWPWARETGIIEEIFLEDRKFNHIWFDSGIINSLWDLVLYKKIREQENLYFYLNTSVRDVIMQKDKIVGVIAEQVGSWWQYNLQGKMFIDCTGDGIVGYLAGAEYRYGRESQKEYKEKRAPSVPDDKTQGNTLMFKACEYLRPVKFSPPRWAKNYKDENSLKWRHHSLNKKDNQRLYNGYWWIEIGSPYHTISDIERIRDELLSHLLGVWDHIKNTPHPDTEKMVLEWIGMVVGKRESIRLIGDYILTEKDVKEGKIFEDGIAYGGWYLDIHTIGGILKKNLPPEPSCNREQKSIFTKEYFPPVYSIPIRCIYSKNIKNLLMAGRNISVTHVALGSTRVMLTGAVLGQAAGTIAAMCIKRKLYPREIAKRYIKEVQQSLLKDDAFIPGIKNEDPNDIARECKVEASSISPLLLEPTKEKFLVTKEEKVGIILPFTEDYLRMIKLFIQPKDPSSQLKIDLTISRIKNIWNPYFTKDPLNFSFDIKLHHSNSQWIECPIETSIIPGLYLILITPHQDMYWYKSNILPGVVGIKKIHKSFHANREIGAIRLDPVSNPFLPSNIVNGKTKPEEWPNLWISHSDKGLPQSIEILFPEKKVFNCIHITFDTGLHRRWEVVAPLSISPEVITDYQIQVKTPKGWKTIIKEKENYQRKRIHFFPSVKTDKVRICCLKAGINQARIYEVRIYNETSS